MLKLSNGAALYFQMLMDGPSIDELKANIRCAYESYDLNDAIELFNKAKFYGEAQEYAICPWGYDQTNYDNLRVVGEVKGSVVIVTQRAVYTVSKNKFVNKKPAYLDNFYKTTWEEPYSSKERGDQLMENAMMGH